MHNASDWQRGAVEEVCATHCVPFVQLIKDCVSKIYNMHK